MTIVSTAEPAADERLDLHNANVDQLAARTGSCAVLELTSGRICIRPARHAGPCDFVPRVRSAGPRRPP